MPPSQTSASQKTDSNPVGVQGGGTGSKTIGTGAGGVTTTGLGPTATSGSNAATGGGIIAGAGSHITTTDAPEAINAVVDTAYKALEANQNVVGSTIAAASGVATDAFTSFGQGQQQQQNSLQDALNLAGALTQAQNSQVSAADPLASLRQYEPIILLGSAAVTVYLLLKSK